MEEPTCLVYSAEIFINYMTLGVIRHIQKYELNLEPY